MKQSPTAYPRIEQDVLPTIPCNQTAVKAEKNNGRQDRLLLNRSLMNFFNQLGDDELERFKKLIAACAGMLLSDRPNEEKEWFLVRSGSQLASIHISQIAFFYTQHKITYLKTTDDKVYMLRCSMEEIEHSISSNHFFRISRQVIVSRRAIKKIVVWFNGTLKIDMMPGNQSNVIISKLRAPRFRQWLGE